MVQVLNFKTIKLTFIIPFEFYCFSNDQTHANKANFSFQAGDESVNVLYHPPDLEGPILFSYREKVFFGKKRAAVRVENGEWSEKFALDAAGSTGLVECKADGVKYEVN